jgi:hypothetical protein
VLIKTMAPRNLCGDNQVTAHVEWTAPTQQAEEKGITTYIVQMQTVKETQALRLTDYPDGCATWTGTAAAIEFKVMPTCTFYDGEPALVRHFHIRVKAQLGDEIITATCTPDANRKATWTVKSEPAPSENPKESDSE